MEALPQSLDMSLDPCCRHVLRPLNENIPVNVTADTKPCSEAQGTRRIGWYVSRNPRRGAGTCLQGWLGWVLVATARSSLLKPQGMNLDVQISYPVAHQSSTLHYVPHSNTLRSGYSRSQETIAKWVTVGFFQRRML